MLIAQENQLRRRTNCAGELIVSLAELLDGLFDLGGIWGVREIAKVGLERFDGSRVILFAEIELAQL